MQLALEAAELQRTSMVAQSANQEEELHLKISSLENVRMCHVINRYQPIIRMMK